MIGSDDKRHALWHQIKVFKFVSCSQYIGISNHEEVQQVYAFFVRSVAKQIETYPLYGMKY